ncbi:MAG TPA: glycosyltransferase family 2 protein, partial [Paracoccaceae bacterium]|nr:glycosyltransferase family 2 protein [Paracoccaceae bacterium]
MKNEGPFIPEWVAYHRAIGFTDIIICSNDSTDGTTELLDALDAGGYIKHFKNEVPKGFSAQELAGKRF